VWVVLGVNKILRER
jgi:hypothetical protein